MKNILVVLALFVSTSSFAQTPSALCDASQVAKPETNYEVQLSGGHAVFINPACKIMDVYTPIFMTSTPGTPEVFNADNYCILKGYKSSNGGGFNPSKGRETSVLLNSKGEIEAIVTDSLSFTHIECVK